MNNVTTSELNCGKEDTRARWKKHVAALSGLVLAASVTAGCGLSNEQQNRDPSSISQTEKTPSPEKIKYTYDGIDAAKFTTPEAVLGEYLRQYNLMTQDGAGFYEADSQKRSFMSDDEFTDETSQAAADKFIKANLTTGWETNENLRNYIEETMVWLKYLQQTRLKSIDTLSNDANPDWLEDYRVKLVYDNIDIISTDPLTISVTAFSEDNGDKAYGENDDHRIIYEPVPLTLHFQIINGQYKLVNAS